MTGPVFVDANVFLYARDEIEPAKMARARAWLEYLWRESLGCTSTQVLAAYYVNLKRKAGARLALEAAWQDVAKYLAWRPQPVDEAVLNRAHDIEQRYRLSWWDSMVVAAAQLQECALLLTEDLHDGAVFGAVTVRSPFTLSAEQPPPAYAAPPAAASRHRRRGRPKRVALP
ncbi:MAG: PIN domain-containing protein [Betaproteobacteria bacterium]|nr:PIN domain-containing protein [Betaproteobacteria bacterium]